METKRGVDLHLSKFTPVRGKVEDTVVCKSTLKLCSYYEAKPERKTLLLKPLVNSCNEIKYCPN